MTTIKSIIKLMATANCIAVAIVSCDREQLAPDISRKETAEIRFSSTYLSSKTKLEGENVIWSSGDRISVTYLASSSWASSLSNSESLAGDCELAEFTVPVELTASISSKTRFYAVYPVSAVDAASSTIPVINVTVPTVQSPSDGNFDKDADLMWAYSEKTYSAIPEESVPLIWDRPLAHLDLRIKSLGISTEESIESIAISSGSNLAGKCKLELQSGKLSISEGSTGISIDPSNLSISASGDLHFIVPVIAGSVSSLTVDINTPKGCYSKSVNSTLALLANRRNTITLDFSGVEPVGGVDPAKEALVNERIFSIMDLDRAGLEEVREAYKAQRLYDAATALRKYWRQRTSPVNPDVDLSESTLSDTDRNIADQALRENGYRFYVKNYYESINSATGLPVFWSFMAADGSIDWNILPTTETQFAIQKFRHQWIDSQAKAYWATKDDKYVKAIDEVYSDFLKTFPCPGAASGNYAIASGNELRDIWTDLQATSRTLAYLNVLNWCISSDSFTPEFLTHLLSSLYDTVECIRANLYHTEASNHRLYEVEAIYYASVLLPEFKSAESWESESYTSIQRQSEIQFAEDGVQNEMDPSYHIAVISTFYEMYNLALSNGIEGKLPSGYVERLRKACGFVRDIMYPDYSLENFNDTRSLGWTKRVLKKNFTKYTTLFPDDGTFQWMANEGSKGTAPTGTYQSYPHSGWHIFRSGWTASDQMLILKNNYNDFGWWHCQPDNGTISLYRNGRHFLPDAGVYTYGGSASDNALREQFQSTAMHNTITLDGKTLTTMLGKCLSESRGENVDMVKVSNASYSTLLSHERSVYHIKDKGYFIILDKAEGSASGTVDLHWHFCPGTVKFETIGSSFGATTAFGDGNDMHWRTFCFDGTTSVDNFNSTTGTSWTSDIIGSKTERPCCSVGITKSASKPVHFVSVIVPVSTSTAPSISASLTDTNLTVTIDGNSTVLEL